MWRIKLVLEGGLVHMTNDVRSGKPGWAECRPSGIERMEFTFKGKEGETESPLIIVLSGMSEYNFFVEASKSIMGGKTTIKGLWFLGRIPYTNKVTGFVVRDSVQIINAISGQEYSGFATAGWKKGIVGGKILATMGRAT
jgi:hypothetical protein